MTMSTTITTSTDLLRVADLARPQLDQILKLASQMKARPLKWVKALRGQSLACVFEQPSTRTRVSFAAAANETRVRVDGCSKTQAKLWPRNALTHLSGRAFICDASLRI